MMESISHLALQEYWWIINSLLGALLVSLMFVQGGQTLIFTLAKNKQEKTLLLNSLGRKWEITFTTLVTFGGAMFASFPLFYSTSFGGAYWVWMAILFAFIIQAISYEYRSKPNNFLGARTYEVFLFINGLLAPLLIGIAVATFFTGSQFYVNDFNHSFWKTKFGGLEAVLSLHNLSLGLAVSFLSRILASLYFMNNIDNENIYKNSKKELLRSTVFFLIFFLYFVIRLLLSDGFAVNPETKLVSLEAYKYFNNLIEMPAVLITFVLGVGAVLFGIIKSLISEKYTKGVWFSTIGSCLAVFALLLISGLNNTSFYPSTYDMQSSLTIENSSSSKYTLTAMSYVSMMIPFVLAYIIWAWRAINSTKLNTEELDKEEHVY